MESKAVVNKFELSVKRALIMILVYMFIVPFFIQIPFIVILETSFSKSHEAFEVVVLSELIANIIIVVLILKKIRKSSGGDY